MCIWFGGWIGWGVLKGYEWIGRGEKRTYTIVFVTLMENISLVHETIVPINVIKLTKNK